MGNDKVYRIPNEHAQLLKKRITGLDTKYLLSLEAYDIGKHRFIVLFTDWCVNASKREYHLLEITLDMNRLNSYE